MPIEQIKESSSTQHKVESALVTLVEHYKQPIHHETAVMVDPPYFDELLGQPMSLPPFVTHLVERLLELDSPQDTLQRLVVEGYVTTVRGNVLDYRLTACGNEVLKHYELLLCEIMKETMGLSKTKVPAEFKKSVHALTTDVTMLTAATRNDKELEKEAIDMLRNFTLPTMLRILYHALGLLDGDNEDPEFLSMVATTLLAFGTPRLTPQNVTKDLPGNAVSFIENCAYPPANFQCNVNLFQDDYWDSIQLDGTGWDDPVSGTSTRAALGCWNALGKCFIKTADDFDSLQGRVCRELGIEVMARSIRAHFFGRDKFPEEITEESLAISKPPQNFPLGTKNAHTKTEMPFEEVPSRIHVAINFIALLSSPHVTATVLEDVLPVCYALLDSSSSTHKAMGASALIHLFDQATSGALSEFGDGIVSVLELACRGCREGPALCLICMSRSIFFGKVSSRQKERRQATAQLLQILQRNSFRDRDTDDHLVVALLVGGIVPLLFQHAMELKADSLEMGRVGLTSLLPLLSWDYNVDGRRVQLASLIALANLLMGAYPMMPQHGGKIMSALLASTAEASQHMEQTDDDAEALLCKAIVDMSQHCAAMAVALCGERAVAVLDYVEQEGNYENHLFDCSRVIRTSASLILQKERTTNTQA